MIDNLVYRTMIDVITIFIIDVQANRQMDI